MTIQEEPQRLFESLEAPPGLRRLLVHAYEDVPSLAEKTQLLQATLGRGVSGGPAIYGRTPGLRWATGIARHATKVLSMAAVVGVGAGSLYVAGITGRHPARAPGFMPTVPSLQGENAGEPTSSGPLVEPIVSPTRSGGVEPIGALHDAPTAHVRTHLPSPHTIRYRPSATEGASASAGSIGAEGPSPRAAAVSPSGRSEMPRPQAGPVGSAERPVAKPEASPRVEPSHVEPSEEQRMAAAGTAEVSLLRSARQALATSPGRTLSLTDEHRRRYPHGILDQEREALAIEALAKLGRLNEARTRAGGFELAYPNSPHRARIEHALAGVPGAATQP